MEIRRVAVIGSGQMGTGMAQVTARAGFETILMKMTEGPVEAGKQKIAKALQRDVEKQRCTQEDLDATLGRLSCTNTHPRPLRVRPHHRIGHRGPRGETAALRAPRGRRQRSRDLRDQHLDALGDRARRGYQAPDSRDRSALLQSRPGHEARRDRAHAADRRRGARRRPGLHRTLQEVRRADPRLHRLRREPPAHALHGRRDAHPAGRSGVDRARSTRRCSSAPNHPMGPLALADFIGLDIVFHMSNNLYEEYREPRFTPPPLLRRLVLAGYLGRKSGKGFYDYSTDAADPERLPGEQRRLARTRIEQPGGERCYRRSITSGSSSATSSRRTASGATCSGFPSRS